MPRLLTRAQFARELGVSKARITQLVQSGVIPIVEEYSVLKPFIEEIDGKKFLIPAGTLMRVYRDGRKNVEVAFFPPEKGGAR